MTTLTFDLLVQGGTCVTAEGSVEADVGIVDGRIAKIGQLANAPAGVVFDARGLHILPGVMDVQVHFREPGMEHKEDLETGTAAAAMGGVTSIFEMPNTRPNTDSEERINDKIQRATGRAWVDFAFFVGATHENALQLGELERLEGCCGVKIFMGSSTGTLLVDDDETIETILRHGSRRVAVHCEDEIRLNTRRALVEGADTSVLMHPEWRDTETALLATKRLVTLARKAGRRVQVLHVTTAEEVALLEEYRDVATFETTPQHLTFTAPDCYERLGSYAQMNPPIRTAEHRAALWQALQSGLLTNIATDHAPHTREEKERPYPNSPSGMPGVQTLVPVMLDHVHQGRLSMERLVQLLCHGPAEVYQAQRKGHLKPGFDGDLTIVDRNAKRTILNEQSKSRCGWTPFHGTEVTGWPIATIVRGKIVMREDELQNRAIGRPVAFDL